MSQTPHDTSTYILTAEDITMSFGGVKALKGASITMRSGEVTALIGDNGAGKSTLVRCLSGIYKPSSGTITIDGKPVQMDSPNDARTHGVETVHQTLALVEELSVWQNFFLGRELTKGVGPLRLLDRKAMRAAAAEQIAGLAVNAPPVTGRVRRLSGGQRQAVAIARAAGYGSHIVIMDEPTAALGVQETARVEATITKLKESGVAVLLISHNFDQVMRLSDQVWVMRAPASPWLGGAPPRPAVKSSSPSSPAPKPPEPGPPRPLSRFSPKELLMPINPLGVHALVYAGGTTPGEVDTIVARSAAAGYDLVEISLHDSANLDVAAARRAIADAGLSVVCSRGLAFDADVSSDDIHVVQRGAALLQTSLQITHDLGGAHFTGALYSALGKYNRPLSAAGRANVVGVLRDLATEAAARSMTLGLEICNRYETNVINTAADALRLADDIGADNVVIHLDTYHMNIEEDDFVRPVHLVGERLGYVHIGENHRGYLGSGHLDFGAFFHALADIRYAGPITFESFSSAVVSPTLSNDLAIWRNLWDDGDELARHAHAYLTNGLAAVHARG